MVDVCEDWVIAVDAGGTRCRLALLSDERAFRVERGPANVSSDFDGAVQEIRAGLADLAAQAGLGRDALRRAPAFVGAAGVVGEALAARLAKALPLDHVRVADDRPAAVAGALGAGDGVLAHCGTGSFFAAQRAGRIRLAGGWGPVLGDEASARWIGVRALNRTLQVTDDILAPSPLTDALFQRFGSAAGMVAFAGSATPAEIGGLSPLVADHAAAGDPNARAILTAAGDHIERTAIRLGWAEGLAICLTGGVGPALGPYLPDRLQAAVVAPLAEPLDGAIALANAYRRASLTGAPVPL